jgi:EmrB/QacA subfamily drug resistance transporter
MEAKAARAAVEPLSRSTVLGLVAMGVAVLVIANDFTALSVALPAIEQDLDAELSTVQWVINAYALTFGVLIVTGGRLADTFGRRRAFVAGAAIFAGFSALGGAAQGVVWLLACRALMGIGGALMWPAILGMTYAVTPRSRAGLAGGIILGAAGLGNAIGPLLGGALTDALSWRWIFFVNVPVAVVGVLVTLWAIPPDAPDAEHERLDVRGVATLSAGLVALLVALDQSDAWGWEDPRILALAAICVVMLAAFGLVERRAGDAALVPPTVMGNARFAWCCVAVLLMSAVFFAALLYLPQFMSKELDFSAVQAGAGLLPMMATFAATSFAAGPIYTRAGPKVVVSAGAACITVGILLLSRISGGDDYAALVPGMAVLGVGVGLFYSSVTTAAVTALDESRASLAGGIVYMCQIGGGSVGLGLNTAIVTASDSLVDGIRNAFLLDAVLAFCALLVSLLFVGGPLRGSRARS